jgi:hypothetical protein
LNFINGFIVLVLSLFSRVVVFCDFLSATTVLPKASPACQAKIDVFFQELRGHPGCNIQEALDIEVTIFAALKIRLVCADSAAR